MSESLKRTICALMRVEDIDDGVEVQSLWSGYGAIKRYHASSDPTKSIIVKHVALPDDVAHPRGWNTTLSHERKVRSYQVEQYWYEHYAHRCDAHCRVPRSYDRAQLRGTRPEPPRSYPELSHCHPEPCHRHPELDSGSVNEIPDQVRNDSELKVRNDKEVKVRNDAELCHCHPESPHRHPELDSGSVNEIPDQVRNDEEAKVHNDAELSRCHPELDSGSASKIPDQVRNDKELKVRNGEKVRVQNNDESSGPNDEYLMILEDLDAAGFPMRHDTLTYQQMQPCIHWLANFHVLHLNVNPKGLWEEGSYWHLDTRPNELEALDDLPLKNAAAAIDKKLKDCRYQTLVHGDAKLANFCFSEDGQRVAAVDFQYVGGGCGMKDLAYFIGSCLYEDDCDRYEQAILDDYFSAFSEALERLGSKVDASALESEWRALFKYAWADFHRFVKGWSPGHWKINTYSERITKEVIDELGC